MSQTTQIANYLNKGRKLTPIDALNKFGCFRLAARIADLRNDGMNIKTTIVKLKNKKQGCYFTQAIFLVALLQWIMNRSENTLDFCAYNIKKAN